MRVLHILIHSAIVIIHKYVQLVPILTAFASGAAINHVGLFLF